MISRVFRMLTMLATISLSLSVFAAKEPIYINLATNDSDKVAMALNAGHQYSEYGFPIIIYLNDKAVILGVELVSEPISKGHIAIKQAIAKGATVIICPTCLKNYGFTRSNLMQGVLLGAKHSNSR